MALLERTRSVGRRLDEAELGKTKKNDMMALFENYSGGERYNAGRDYGLSHTLPFRITGDQPGLMRGIAMIHVVRANSPWLNELIRYMEYDLTEGSFRSGGGNADMLADVQPRTSDPNASDSRYTVTAGYLADLERYTGTVCYAPMRTLDMYEGALTAFLADRLTAEELAVRMSEPKRDPNK